MESFILKENVLTDNVLLMPEDGKVFKGGYIAIVKEFEYQNAWADKLSNIRMFRSNKVLMEFLGKNYPCFELPS